MKEVYKKEYGKGKRAVTVSVKEDTLGRKVYYLSTPSMIMTRVSREYALIVATMAECNYWTGTKTVQTVLSNLRGI